MDGLGDPMGLDFFNAILDIASQDCEDTDIVVTDDLIIKSFIELGDENAS